MGVAVKDAVAEELEADKVCTESVSLLGKEDVGRAMARRLAVKSG